MSALSGHQASGNTTETSPEDTTRKLDHVLQHFDVIASRRDTFIFRFLPVSLIGLFFLFVLTIISIDILISFHPQSTVPPGYTPQFQIEVFLFYIGFNATPLIGILLTLWTFNIWRSSVPKTLRDIFEKKLIAVPGDDVTKHYLRFLENYRRALGSPKRYLLNALPACSVALLYLADVMTTTISYVSSTHPIIIVAIFLIIAGLLGTFGILGGLYGLGTLVWVVCISGGYIVKLSRAFTFRIRPLHPDKCGGFKVLGNFCFGLETPVLIISGFTIGSIVITLLSRNYDPLFRSSYMAIVGFGLLLLVLFTLPATIFAFVLPLWTIHTKMASEQAIEEEHYVASREILQEQIQTLLDDNKVEDAKTVKEKKELMEAFYTPYPTWPFNFKTKFLSALIGAGSSLLLGALTALMPALVKEILQFIGFKI